MPLLRIVEPGMFTTVQDLGRQGHGASGVPPSGAADALSLTIGNRLLGNPDGAAALECTLVGPSVTFDHDSWISLTGAALPKARVAGSDGERPLPWCEPVRIHAGELIKLGNLDEGRELTCVCRGGSTFRPCSAAAPRSLVLASVDTRDVSYENVMWFL